MKKILLTILITITFACLSQAEDSSCLWLRSQRNMDLCDIKTNNKSNIAQIVIRELSTY